MGQFEGKRVIVTGAASGFGAAISRRFAAEGARVLVADINEAGAKDVAAGLEKAIPFASEEQTQAMASAAVAAWGGIDIVCANAGVPHLVSPLIEIDTDVFDRQFATNTRSVYFAAKHCVPHMADGSALIATSSIGARFCRPGLTPYYASKGAVETMVRGLAIELAPRIRVNGVAPVSSPTGFDKNSVGLDELPPEVNAQVISGIPMGRRATPEDVAGAVAYLASEEAAFLTGVILDIDGGRSIG